MAIDPHTRRTLLARLREGDDADAWGQFEHTYRDLLVRFCRSLGIQAADADDISQMVLLKLVNGLKRFEYDPARGRFRDYLFRCARSTIADWKSRPTPRGWSVVPGGESALGRDGEDGLAAAFEREWVDHHYRRALRALREQMEPRSVEVMEALIRGRSVAQAGAEFQMTEDAVYKIQQRARQRLRELIESQVRDENDGDA